MPISRIFLWSALAFIAGVVLGSIATIPRQAIAAALLGAAVLFGLGFPRKRAVIGSLCLAAACGGIQGYATALERWQSERSQFLTLAARQSPVVEATVRNRLLLPQTAIYELEQITVVEPETRLALTGRYRLALLPHVELEPGEHVRLHQATFRLAEDGKRLLAEGIAGTLSFPKALERIGPICGAPGLRASCWRLRLSGMLVRLRERLEKNLAHSLPDPQAALAAGLLLGSRTAIPATLKEAFARTGLTHITAVSGYNVTIIITALDALLSFLLLPRQVTFWTATALTVIFALLTGASASVIRASIMAFLVILARKEFRLYSARLAITAAAAVMLLQNPLLLRHDLGFLLSFLATAGLVTLYPALAERSQAWPALGGLKETLLQTLSAQAYVLPLLILAFGSVSLVSPLANVLVLPLIPATMLASFAAGIGAFLPMPLNALVALPAYVLLSLEIALIHWLSRIPYAALATPHSWKLF